MATNRQAAEALDAVLRLPPGSTRIYADRLRSAGKIAAAQGVPAEMADRDVAMVLLSVLVGCAADTSRVAAYATLRPISGGPPLIDALAEFLSNPSDLFELRVDVFAPAAVLTFRAADRGMRIIHFTSPEHYTRPAFERASTLTGGTLIELVATLKSAPKGRVGRRKFADRYARLGN